MTIDSPPELRRKIQSISLLTNVYDKLRVRAISVLSLNTVWTSLLRKPTILLWLCTLPIKLRGGNNRYHKIHAQRARGKANPYEQLKELTRGKKMTAEIMRQFINGLDIPADDKQRLLALTPAAYTGIASKLVDTIG